MNDINYKKGIETGLFLVFVVLLPYFPIRESMASYNVNIAYLAIVLAAILMKGGFVFDVTLKKVFFVFVFLQSLLLFSFISTSELFGGIGVFGSLLRPVVIYLFILYFYQGFNNINNHSDFISYIKGLTKPLVFVSILYIFLGGFEFLVGDFTFINLFYKRSNAYMSGIEFSSTTFMGSTYPSAFLGFFLLNILFLINKVSKKRYISVVCVFLIVMIVLSQSKPFILLAIFFYASYFVFAMGEKITRLVLSVFLIISPLLYFHMLDVFTKFLELISPNLKAARSMLVMISDTSSSGTLNTRLEQVFLSIDLVSEKLYLIGAGLGQEIYLESWIAEIIYRYGFLGLFIYVVVYLIITFKLYKYVFHARENIIFFSLFYWFSSLIFSQLSGLQIENGKTMVLSAFMFSLIMFVLRKKDFLLKN